MVFGLITVMTISADVAPCVVLLLCCEMTQIHSNSLILNLFNVFGFIDESLPCHSAPSDTVQQISFPAFPSIINANIFFSLSLLQLKKRLTDHLCVFWEFIYGGMPTSYQWLFMEHCCLTFLLVFWAAGHKKRTLYDAKQHSDRESLLCMWSTSYSFIISNKNFLVAITEACRERCKFRQDQRESCKAQQARS